MSDNFPNLPLPGTVEDEELLKATAVGLGAGETPAALGLISIRIFACLAGMRFLF